MEHVDDSQRDSEARSLNVEGCDGPSRPGLLEQYKLYVEMADRVSTKRAGTNRFYTSILAGLLALLSIVVEKGILAELQLVVFLAIAVLGLTLCGIWFMHIRSYKQLNAAKYEVIHEIEAQLPFPCYRREWVLLGAGKDWRKYVPVTKVEAMIPCLVSTPYFILLTYSIVQLCRPLC